MTIRLVEVHGRYDKYSEHDDRPLQEHWAGGEKKYVPWTWDQDYLVVEVDWKFPQPDRAVRKIVHGDGKNINSAFYVMHYPDGIVSFFHHSGEQNPDGSLKNTGGFSGATYKVRLEDGTEEDVPGPWSSNETHLAQLTPREEWLKSVTVRESPYSQWSASILISKARELLAPTPYLVVPGVYDDSFWYQIVHEDDLERFIVDRQEYRAQRKSISRKGE